MAACRRVYDLRHLQAGCQEPGSAEEPYAQQSSMGYIAYLYLFYRAGCGQNSRRREGGQLVELRAERRNGQQFFAGDTRWMGVLRRRRVALSLRRGVAVGSSWLQACGPA